LVLPYLENDEVGVDAAAAAAKLSSALMEKSDDAGREDLTRVLVESRVSPRIRPQVATAFDTRMRKNDPPEGFTALFNGKDLTGWKGLVENPLVRATMSPEQLAAAQARADSSMHTHWSVHDGTLVFDGRARACAQ
jgi:hypothetical protein